MLKDILAFPSTPRLADQNFDTPSRPLEKEASNQNSDTPSRGKKVLWFYLIDKVRIKKITQFTCTHRHNIIHQSYSWSIWTQWYFLLSILRRMLRVILTFPSTTFKILGEEGFLILLNSWECRTAGPGFSGIPFYPRDGRNLMRHPDR